ncbi:hypothetical protein KEM55_004371 [Ascosphaera atra]|nr:hypothetical protein KEM55_004371 [Ascosphaera atra]
MMNDLQAALLPEITLSVRSHSCEEDCSLTLPNLSFTGNGNGNRNGHMNAGEITPASPLLAHAQSPQARQPGTWQQQAQQPSNGTLIPHSTRHSQHHHHRRHQDRNNGEKILSQSLLWKRKYHNRQVECAVCLEEYIDGQSRVMSLPCGHEFHAECITPWLTTRRRTCPICKGDVVRSLAQWGRSSGSSSGSRRAQEQDRQYQAASSAPLPSADSPELMGGDMSERAQGHVTIAQDEIVLPPGEAPYEDDDDDLGSSEDGYDYDLEEGITISSPQARRRDSLADARRDAEAEEISAQARATILAAQQGDRYRPASSWQEFAGLGMGVSPFSGDAMWPQPHEQQRRQQGSGQ